MILTVFHLVLHIGTALWRTKKLVSFLSQGICIPNRERRKHVTIGGCFDIFLVVLIGSEGSESLKLQAQWGSAFLAVYVWGPLIPNRNSLHINESIRGHYMNFFQWEINRTWWSNWGKIKALWTSGDSFPRSISIVPWRRQAIAELNTHKYVITLWCRKIPLFTDQMS